MFLSNFNKITEKPGCNMTEEGRNCPEHGLMECPGYKMIETSAQEKLHQRHQEIRKKSGLPDPNYYKELRATFDLPDEERHRAVAALKKKYKIDEAGPFSYGAKKPRKGSVADLAAKKRKEQERGKQPVEPRDHMIGVARVKKDVSEVVVIPPNMAASNYVVNIEPKQKQEREAAAKEKAAGSQQFPINVKEQGVAEGLPPMGFVRSPQRHDPIKNPLRTFVEISNLLGITHNQLNALTKKYPGFPSPHTGIGKQVGRGKNNYYDLQQAKQWIKNNDIQNRIKSWSSNREQGVAEDVDIGREWMSDTEIDQYIPNHLQQDWRELLGYDENGNMSKYWAFKNEPDMHSPIGRVQILSAANLFFRMKKIPLTAFDFKDIGDELEWLIQVGPRQEVAVEGRFDEPLTGWHIVSRAHGQVVRGTPSFETKDQAQKYLMTRMFANHQDLKVVHTAGVAEGKDDLSQYSTEQLKAYVKKVSGGGVPAFGSGAKLKRVQAELKRREQGLAEGSNITKINDYDQWLDRVDSLGAEKHLQKNRTLIVAQTWDGEQVGEFDLRRNQGWVMSPGVSESDPGISYDKETKFHAKLDTLVHDTFGKRKDELEESIEQYLEELNRAGYEVITETAELCPECGGPAFSDQLLAEKKDACYSKVKSRYKVWPSAYASGALVRCRKVGAKNWGNKSKK